MLGEATASEADARAAASAYVEVLKAIARTGLQANVSLKLSQLGLDIAPDLAAELLGGVVQQAAALGNFVRVDMEDSSRLPATLQVFDRVWEAGWHSPRLCALRPPLVSLFHAPPGGAAGQCLLSGQAPRPRVDSVPSEWAAPAAPAAVGAIGPGR